MGHVLPSNREKNNTLHDPSLRLKPAEQAQMCHLLMLLHWKVDSNYVKAATADCLFRLFGESKAGGEVYDTNIGC